VLQLLTERDELGRTPLDIACWQGYKNVALYLVQKMGTPADVVHQELNIDNSGRNCFHAIGFKGNFDCAVALLNLERAYLKKTLYDSLL
jgi:ankyrin repeat protein